jgi:putative molybdopterin biosynthesis protein
MAEAPSKYLTVRALAELLHIKERKVYALAAEGKIPCSRAAGKLLFPRDDVEQWLAKDATGIAPKRKTERPMVIVGSHDPLLDWALRESRSGIPAFFDSSLDGLKRLQDGEAMAGGVHLYEAEDEGWNVRHVADALGDAEIVLLEWAWRERGLIVAPDNPKGISTLADLRGARVVPRQPEAGSQVLFQILLEKAGLVLEDFDLVDPLARSEVDLAAKVAGGSADAGFGLAGIAHQFRLDFVPVVRERYDLVVHRRGYFLEPFQRLIEFCQGQRFAATAREMGGYDVSGFGRVHYLGP